MGRKRRGEEALGWYGGDEMLGGMGTEGMEWDGEGIRDGWMDGTRWMGWRARDDRSETKGLGWEREIIRYGGGWIWRRKRVRAR